jgi:hypothetical protein
MTGSLAIRPCTRGLHDLGKGARAWLLPVVALCLLLAGCIAPALLLPSSGQLMWALLKPLVGFDPNQVNLFEQPLVKNRMVTLLGPNYDATMQLLHTANELRKEGPLFYVVSRYTPVPEMAQKAGLVWNSETNQMAVALMKGDVTEVFAEKIEALAQQQVARAGEAAREGVAQAQDAARDQVDETMRGAVAGVIPVWPAEMSWVNPREAIEKAVEQRIGQGVEQVQTRTLDATVGKAVEAAAPAPAGTPPAAPGRTDDWTPGDPANEETYETPDEELIDEELIDEEETDQPGQ